MKEAPIEGSFTLNSMGQQGTTDGDDFLLKMSFSGQSLEKHSVPETHVQAQGGRYFSLISIPKSVPLCNESEFPGSYKKPHQRWNRGPWRKEKTGRWEGLTLICILLGVFYKC